MINFHIQLLGSVQALSHGTEADRSGLLGQWQFLG